MEPYEIIFAIQLLIVIASAALMTVRFAQYQKTKEAGPFLKSVVYLYIGVAIVWTITIVSIAS